MKINRIATETGITHAQRLWLYIIVALTLAFLMLPVFIVVPMSFSDSRFLSFPPENWSVRWYEHYFNSTEWMNATRISLSAAVLTVLVATPLGTAAAYSFHVSTNRLAGLLRVSLLSPMMIPVILVAIGAFYVFAPVGLNNTITGLVLAHSVLAMPFVIITVTAGLRGYDMNQEKVARSLGATPLIAFLTVTLPQIRFSVMSGAMLAFITSLDEVVVALFISRGEASTLTRKMFTALRDEIDPTIASISTLLILVSTILLILNQFLNKNSNQTP